MFRPSNENLTLKLQDKMKRKIWNMQNETLCGSLTQSRDFLGTTPMLKRKSLHTSQVAHQAEAYPSFW